ncbi:hypothetical protein HELRODRAFT_190918 [Helobdella robusta]|uniref:DNA mismatch repair proteins mutS family domain-containing protein n=1 Tax=Helobdella robusta TaxID=6412 RepID=T1FSF1_HELRO|nr:hypothetical protein HELRODRAFT_190918 [Helobdella robusta]ESO08158.1 hypothetical protein HELRODRAFT_190918 [Helobdella robusta]
MMAAMEVDDATDIKLDSLQEEYGFINYYKSLPEKLASTVRFFDRSDYWTVHGSDALFVANEIFKTITAIKYLSSGNKTLEYVVVKRGNFESVIRDLLLVKQYRIEVYKSKSLKTQEWVLSYKASPGNLSQFEDLLFGGSSDESARCGLISIKSSKIADQNVVGIAFCDVAACKFVVCQLVDDDRHGNVESVVVQLRPRECLLCEGFAGSVGGAGDESLQAVLQRNGVTVTERKKSDFESSGIALDMNRLLKFPKSSQNPTFATYSEANLTVALSSLSASIKYLDLLSDASYFNQFHISTFQFGNFVKLDGAASRALNLLPSPQDGPGSHRSMFTLLNRCRTHVGQKLLSSWIHQPLVDPNQIDDRLDILQRLIDNSELRACLHDDLLRRTPDLQMAARKLQSKKAGLMECYKIYKVVEVLPKFVEVLGRCEEEDEDGGMVNKRCAKWRELFVDPMKELISDFGKFKEMVETTLDLEKVDDNEFLVKSDFDESLQSLSEQMLEVEGKMTKEFNKAARDLGLETNKTIKLEATTQLGYFFRITRKEEKCLRGNERSYHTLDTNKGGVRFRSVPLETLNDRYLSLKEEFVEQQKGVVVEIVSVACGYVEPLSSLIELIAQIDVFVSLAVASLDGPSPYVRPNIIREGVRKLKLLGVRHPCLERQDGVAFIPNDVIMSSDDKTFHIVTGPNMGGKSTYIRSAAMVVLMAQMGCFVPCDLCEMTLVDGVATRVGAGDNQLKGVSTFMAEMLETANILKSATKNSLVIVDELGRGTSTYDGFGLAWSIAKHIAAELECFCLFATHFHELTSLADELSCVTNLHVTAVTSEDKLTLLYKVEKGVCDQSFGIHVAEIVQFPKHVVENARKLASEMEQAATSFVGSNKSNDGMELNENGDDEEKFLSKVTLEEAKNFLSKAKELSADCTDDVTLWNKIQDLKKSMVENCCQ